jgi:hypothetical protein
MARRQGKELDEDGGERTEGEMDEIDGPGTVIHGAVADSCSDGEPATDADPQSLRRSQSVELAAWEWRLVRCALQHTSTALQEQNVGARVAGDRLHSLERQINAQLADDAP